MTDTNQQPTTGIEKLRQKAAALTTKPAETISARTVGKFTIRTAERSKTKIRIGLAGPSGSGKTYSALLMAHGIAGNWENVYIIDTENGSADLYSDMGNFNVLTLEKPFSPDRYVEAIQACEKAGAEVIIVDSITHEWSGEGGCLQIQEQLGGRFQDWAKVTPMHNRFVSTLLASKAHVITTVRSKTDYQMTQDGGKGKVQKVGLKPETREGFEYEMTLSFDLNINNLAEASKDRTGLFKGKTPGIITEETGKTIVEWANSGVDMLAEVRKLLKLKGKTDQPILSTFKVYSIEDLTTAQLKGVIQKLTTLPDAPAEEKKPETKAKKTAEEPEQTELPAETEDHEKTTK